MDSRVKRVAAIGLILSILLALLGQYYFAFKTAFLWDGILIYAVAMGLFSMVVGRLEDVRRGGAPDARPSMWQQFLVVVRGNPLRALAAILGTLAVLYVTYAALRRHHEQPFWDLLSCWSVGVGLTVGAFVRWKDLPMALRGAWHSFKRHSVEATIVALLTLAAFLLRVVHVNSIPFVLSGDEASMGLEAVSVLRGTRTNPFATGWFANPTLYFFLQALFVKTMGHTAAALRLSSVVVSSATVILIYAMAKHFYGRWVGLLSALILASYHYAIHYGRMGLNNVWDPFFALGAFYFFSRGLETRRLGQWLLAALFVGFSVYFHAGSRLTELMLLAYLLYWVVRDRNILHGNKGNLAVFLLVVLVLVLPLFSFFATHPDDMMAPWRRKSIFATGWVASEVETKGRSVASILTKQFLQSILAFNATRDVAPFYQPSIPLLQFVPSIFFVFGLAYAVFRIRDPKYLLLVMWFLAVIVFGGVLLENPPASHRLLLAIPPVVICVALGLSRLADYVGQLLGQPRRLAYALSLALVLLISYQSASFYFGKYTPSHVFSGANTEVADRMGKYLRVLGPGYRCYFFGAPRMFYDFPNIPYFAPDVEGMNLEQPIGDSVTFVNPDRDAVFVFLPERISEFDVVRRAYPTGLKREFKDQRGSILFISYEVDI